MGVSLCHQWGGCATHASHPRADAVCCRTSDGVWRVQPIVLFSTDGEEPVFVNKRHLAWPSCGMVIAVQSNVPRHPTRLSANGKGTPTCSVVAL